MKKVLLVVLVIAFAVVPFCSSFAAGADDWTIFPAFTDGVAHEVEQTEDGIVISSEKGYYGGLPAGGVSWNTLVDPSDFTVKFTIDQNAGDATDQWIQVGLMSKQTYFDVVTDPMTDDQGEGVLSLIHPFVDKITFQSFKHIKADKWANVDNDDPTIAGDPNGKELVVSIKEREAGKYYYTINGEEFSDVEVGDIFGDEGAYFIFGLSNNADRPMQCTIKEINGVAMVPAAETEAPDDDVPQTGQDYTWAIVLGSLAVILAAAGAIMLINKSRKNA